MSQIFTVPAQGNQWKRQNDRRCYRLTILRTGDHPFTLAMKGHTGDISRVSLKCQDSGWVRGFDVVQLDSMVACGCQEAFVWRDA